MILNNDIKVVFCLGILPHTSIIMMQDYSQALSTGSVCWAYPVESVSKMELVLSVTFFWKYMSCICSTGPFEFRWLKRYICNPSHRHHQIASVHLSNCCHIFRFCVPKAVVPSYFVVCYTYIPGTLEPVSIIDGQCNVCANDRVHYCLSTVFVFVHITLITIFIWKHWTPKMLIRYMLPRVCLRLYQLSQLYVIQHMGLYVFSLVKSPVVIKRICSLLY